MNNTVQTLKLGLAAFLLAMTSSTLLAALPNTGIQGHAELYISYGTPDEVAPGIYVGVGDVELPVTTSFSIYTADTDTKFGHSDRELIGHFTSDETNGFEVSLKPGKYAIVPDDLTFSFTGSIPTSSFNVTVRGGKVSPIIIFYFHDGPLSFFTATSPD
jgi:hypothetical protein